MIGLGVAIAIRKDRRSEHQVASIPIEKWKGVPKTTSASILNTQIREPFSAIRCLHRDAGRNIHDQ
jgi:hypothetical protein